MLNLNTSTIAEVAEQHLLFCKPEIEKRIDFYLCVFDRLGYKNKVEVANNRIPLSNIFNLNGNAINSLMTPLIKEKKVSNPAVFKFLVHSGRGIIRDSNDIDKFKTLYNLFRGIKENLDEILIGDPMALEALKNDPRFQKQNEPLEKNLLEKVFQYERLTDEGYSINKKNWNSYVLTKSIGINTCAYCNRNWVNTVTEEGQKVTNPQLDHFFSKDDNPLFRLSFYNLIPSCETCNSRLKGKIEFDFEKHLHPYVSGYDESAKFVAIPLDVDSNDGRSENFEIELEFDDNIHEDMKSKIETNHEVFKLNEIYKHHGDIISEIYRKKHVYSGKYLDVLKNNLDQFSNMSDDEMYRLAFGNYQSQPDFHKRPLAKLTKDITDQLGITKVK